MTTDWLLAVSNGWAERLKNLGPRTDGNINLGGGTSLPDPNDAENVGMGFSLDGNCTFSMSELYTAVKSSPGKGSCASTEEENQSIWVKLTVT